MWVGAAVALLLLPLVCLCRRLVPIVEVRAAPYRPLRALPAGPIVDADLLRRACCGSLSPYEVAIGARKLVGLAQVRRRGGVLFQVRLPLIWRGARPSCRPRAPPTGTAWPSSCARAIGLDDLLPTGAPAPVIMAALEAVPAHDWGVHLESTPA